MTAREVPAALLAELEREASAEAILAFLTIRHPGLREPIRVVSDVFDYVYGGATYTGLVFGFAVLTDTEEQPYTQLVVQNADRRIGQALLGMNGSAQIAVDVLAASHFDLAQVPRQPVGTPVPSYRFTQFELANVTTDAAEITGRVQLRTDYAQEPWPRIYATQNLLPALYR